MLVAVAVVGLLWYYPNSNTTLLVKIVVGLAWFAALSVLVLVPADLLATLRYDTGAYKEKEPLLKAWWSIAYWYAFVGMMSVLPILQGYADSGHFHPWDRFLYALRTNVKFYSIIGALGLVGLLLLLIWKKMGLEAIIGWGMAISNAYGLIGAIFLMGYGLVDIPRKLWQMADVRSRELIMFHRAGVQVERAGKAHYELSHAIGLVHRVSGLFGRRDNMRPYLDRILGMIDRVGDFTPREIDIEDEDLDLDYYTIQDLGKLRRSLRHGIEGFQRERETYLQIVRSYLKVHDIVKNMDKVGLPFASPDNVGAPPWLKNLEWWWKCRIQPVAMRASAVFLGILSLAVLIAQVAISEHLPNVSIFAQIIHITDYDSSVFFLSFLLFLYPALAVYYTLFKLGRFSFYLLTPRHTAPYSLVSNALFMSRFAFPLAFNFLAALAAPIGKTPQPDIRDTVFYKDLGKPMAEQPIFGTNFTTYVPIILLPYMVLVVFNVFNRLAGIVDRSQNLSFDEDWDVTSTYASTGKTMLRIEVENRDAGQALGLTVTQGHVHMTNSHGHLAAGIDSSQKSTDTARLGRDTRKVPGTDSRYQSALEKGVGFSEPRSQATDRASRDGSRLDNIFTDITSQPLVDENSRQSRGGYTPLGDNSSKPPGGVRGWFGKGRR